MIRRTFCLDLVLLLGTLVLKFILFTYSAEQEGIKADPIEVSQFISFVKRNKLPMETFFIGENQCKWSGYILQLLDIV